MADPVLWVVECKHKGQWQPTNTSRCSRSDARKEVHIALETYPGVAFRVAKYVREGGKRG